MDHTTQTGLWMKSNNILVNNDWLQACIEWIHEEHQGTGLSEDELRTRVYEQWLLADLHELETSCLPQAIQNHEKYELNGAFALQIDSIVDVGTSFYSQQVKIKGKENANVHVTADDPNQKPWEPKPSRMLLFKLTDGTCNVQGMEYKKITCLNQQTKPGTKIIVHGNVLCRHGILMLSEHNIKHLGGEVDTLVEANTVTQVLQSAMEASEEHAGKNHRQTFNGSTVRRNGQPKLENQSRQTYTSRNNVSQSGRLHNKTKKEPVSQTRVGGMQVANINQNISEVVDGFSDDDEFLEEMNIDDFLPVQNTNSNKTANNYSIPTHSRQMEQKPKPAPNISCNPSLGYQRDRNGNSKTPGTSLNNISNKISVNSTGVVKPNEFEDFDEMDFEDDLEAEFLLMAERENKKQEPTRQTGNLFGNQSASSYPQMLSGKQSNSDKQLPSNKIQSNVTRIKTENNTINQNKIKTSNVKSTRKDSESFSDINTDGSDNLCGINQSGQGVQVKTSRTTLPKSGTTATLTSTDFSSKSKQSETVESIFASKVQNLKTEDEATRKEKVDIDMEYPFTYLSKVMSIQRPEQPSYHTVKAYISTLTSKLSSSEGRWTLSCKINDGTMAVDVDLSDQVLTEMIGFSTKESVVMRQKMKTDPKMKQILQEGIKQCQQKLIDLMCLLELEVCVRNPRPIIVAKKQLSHHHIDMLYNRVMASWNV